MSLARAALDAVDAIGEHPAVVELAKHAPAGIDVPAVARSVARRLVGAPRDGEDPLAGLLFAIAGAELSLLCDACRDDPLKAALATVALLNALIPRYSIDPPPKPRPGRGTDSHSRRHNSLRQKLESLNHRSLPPDFPLPQIDDSAARDPVRLAASLADALDVDGAAHAAWTELAENRDLLDTLARLIPGFGWDFSPGDLGQSLLEQLPLLSALLDKLPSLQRICDELGRLEGRARRQSSAQRGGREEVVGVRVGGELADVLPVELALLGETTTEDLFYQRLIEHRLMCLELQGTVLAPHDEGEKRGPIIACIDTSGSMAGAAEEVAKALVLAVARQARRQRRPVRLLLFGGPGEITEKELREGRAGLNTLLEFLAMGFRAGTDFDSPLRRAAQLLDHEIYDKADILVVTDGLGATSRDTRDELRGRKRERGFRILSVVVGGNPHGVRDFSDDVWLVSPGGPLPSGIDVRLSKPLP
ncbi:MAG: VWA domain-containing protein [Proteobacteria bacterium]|nr:VWA domain-containing protein [Pseudomonadota bacterium]